MVAGSQVSSSFLSALRAHKSHWRAAIADDCGILVYRYGRRGSVSHSSSLCSLWLDPGLHICCLGNFNSLPSRLSDLKKKKDHLLSVYYVQGTEEGTICTVSSGPLNNSADGASLPPLMDEESAAWRSEPMSPSWSTRAT